MKPVQCLPSSFLSSSSSFFPFVINQQGGSHRAFVFLMLRWIEATFGHSLGLLVGFIGSGQGPFVTLEQNGLWQSL